MSEDFPRISWEYNVSLLTNMYMLLDFVRLFVATFFLADIVLLIVTGFSFESVIPLTVTGIAVFIGLLLLISLLLGNHVRIVFTLDSFGVGSKVSRRMSKINAATTVLGTLLGNPSGAGAGLLASSKGASFHPWIIFHKATVDNRRRVISFQNNWRSLQRVYCHEDNMRQVVDVVERMLPGKVVYKN